MSQPMFTIALECFGKDAGEADRHIGPTISFGSDERPWHEWALSVLRAMDGIPGNGPFLVRGAAPAVVYATIMARIGPGISVRMYLDRDCTQLVTIPSVLDLGAAKLDLECEVVAEDSPIYVLSVLKSPAEKSVRIPGMGRIFTATLPSPIVKTDDFPEIANRVAATVTHVLGKVPDGGSLHFATSCPVVLAAVAGLRLRNSVARGVRILFLEWDPVAKITVIVPFDA